MTGAHTSGRGGDGAVYETEVATVRVRPRRIDGGRGALEYAIETDHPAPVRVRVRQPIPDSIAFEDLGFPGNCGEEWQRDGEDLVFEREIDPGAVASTAWGVDGDVGEDLEPPVVAARPVASDAEPSADAGGVAGDAIEEEARDTAGDETGDAIGNETEDAFDETVAAATPEGADGEAETGQADASLELDLDELSDPMADDADPMTDDVDPAAGVPGGSSPADGATTDEVGNPPLPDESRAATGGALADDVVGDAGGSPATTGDESLPQAGVDGESRGPTDVDAVASSEETDVDAVVSSGETDGGESAGNSGADVADAETGPSPGTAESDPADGPADGAVTGTGDAADSLLHRLVEELHDDALDDGHRAALADALEVRLSDSTNAFVEHVRERQRRRTERVEDDVEALEESVEGLYGLKADASEVRALKRAITDLDDAKAGDAELRELRSRVAALDERAADAEAVETLRGDQEALAAALESTDETVADVERAAEADREAIRSTVETVESELTALEERAATVDRLETLADDLEALQADAATESELEALEESLGELEAAAATTEDLDALRDDVDEREAALEERIDLLADRHDDLAADAATAAALDSLREDHRDRLNGVTSDVQSLRETVETEYSADDEIEAAIDRRVHRGLAHLLAFAIGAIGLVATVPLAVAGSAAAAVTFAGAAVTLGLWWRAVGPSGVGERDGSGLRWPF